MENISNAVDFQALKMLPRLRSFNFASKAALLLSCGSQRRGCAAT